MQYRTMCDTVFVLFGHKRKLTNDQKFDQTFCSGELSTCDIYTSTLNNSVYHNKQQLGVVCQQIIHLRFSKALITYITILDIDICLLYCAHF